MIRHEVSARTERNTVSPRTPIRGPEPPGTIFARDSGPRTSASLHPG